MKKDGTLGLRPFLHLLGRDPPRGIGPSQSWCQNPFGVSTDINLEIPPKRPGLQATNRLPFPPEPEPSNGTWHLNKHSAGIVGSAVRAGIPLSYTR